MTRIRQGDHQGAYTPRDKARSLRLVAQPGQYSPTPEDRALEKQLREAEAAYNRASSRRMKRAIYEHIRKLHRQRSPEMVAHLEREMGLAR